MAKAQSVLKANGQILDKAPFVLASLVSAAMVAEHGLKQVSTTPCIVSNEAHLDPSHE